MTVVPMSQSTPPMDEVQGSFIYRHFSISPERKKVSFEYTTLHEGQEFHFVETLEFPVPLLDTPEQQRSLRALHLALGVSYYKKFLPPQIVHPYAMDETEAAFWTNNWQNGLGEFLYVNKLPVERIAPFTTQDGLRYDGTTTGDFKGTLLGIGGGKDSAVAGELLKAIGVPVQGFVMATGEQLGQAASVAKTMDVPLHTVKRQLDRQLIELKSMPGTYSGHVPISLIFGLVGTTLAIAQGAEYVVVANEASASIPRINWQDRAVNHQWSKSFGFEKDLQRFIHEHIAGAVTYFSAVRQLTSVGVAKIFANFSQYFEVFTSDNSVFRIDPSQRPNGRWSLGSPKTLSSFLLLAPWLDDAALQRIFSGLDLLNESSLQTLFLELTGVQGEPPLDCVGTVEELVLSVNMLAQAGRYGDTYLMQLAAERGVVHDDDWQQRLRGELRLQPDEILPGALRENVRQYLTERLAA